MVNGVKTMATQEQDLSNLLVFIIKIINTFIQVIFNTVFTRTTLY